MSGRPRDAAVVVVLGLLLGLGAARDDFAARAVRELAALQAGTTAATWLAAHVRDHLTPFNRTSIREDHEGWCVRASVEDSLTGGLRVVRYAYFYPPEAPPTLALPSADGDLIRKQCVLGMVWIEAAVSDSASGIALAADVRAALTRAYGPVTPALDAKVGRVRTDSLRRRLARLPGADALALGLHFFGAAGWRTPGRWQVDSTVLASAFDGGLGGHSKQRVLAFAFLPAARLGSFKDYIDQTALQERQHAALAGAAARLSGLDQRLAERLLSALAGGERAYQRGPRPSPASRADLLAALNAWIAGARPLDPHRRAAALLAADQVVGSAGAGYLLADVDSATRRSMEGLGAKFVYSELDGGYAYAHSWLDEALRLDPGGPVARLATLALLRMGFNESGMCGGGAEPFRRVSAEGERLLAGEPDSTAAEVHFLVARGYADVVALASGAGGEYADSATYAADAPEARRRAIAHYRAGLTLDRRSADARSAWLEACQLLAGLPPNKTHFFCVYD
jgi:hypothetical protein